MSAPVNAAKDDEAQPETAPLVMGYTEAAEFLGLSARTLERYVRERRIPYVPLPKRGAWSGVRFLRHQLVQWLERRSVKPSRHHGLQGREED
jgi:excisionase family DNA binding protein